MMALIGFIMMLIGVVAVDYTMCDYFNVLWAFWLQVIGFFLYLLGIAYESKN